ncbi:arsenate reductase ArsC [Eoetvoesiella caeni]|uniref:Arsenate reductase n=1 Tax=Eoetvoesiella caeni TaxID=645616 RepID=A0A366HCZ0_9BURK|nr:arsenate reductase ArsC [Eoetvoesiella caeni]MCI2808835.1 arsenate reductase ArsC [Eoetvoesiella caeni]NYT55665.1 arsenate reductase ArsC [Eoetvoesiella caeni]RBP40223.1 arsenate reductase [Eoetvoesiella caeni]
MSDKIYNTLFLCTGNSARSIMAEVLLNHLGRDRFRAYSAGSHPGAQVNPLTLEVLQSTRLQVEGLCSKSWDEFARPGAPQLDFVITLCDSAAGEVCPVWPGQPITAHWGFEDPSAFEGTAQEKREFFDKIFRQIANRIKIFNSLPLTKLDRVAIKRELDALGDRVTQTSTIAP